MDEDISPNDDVSFYDIYGKTPPRTKILRKIREKKQKHSPGSEMSGIKSHHHKTRHSLSRRNTVSTMYDELIAIADRSDSEQGQANKKANKRHMKLLRGSERDLKLDIASAQASAQNGSKRSGMGGWSHEPKTPVPSYHIESCKRFMSLMSRTFPCHKQIQTECKNSDTCANVDFDDSKELQEIDKGEKGECQPSRVEFYQTLSLLIRMGGGKDERNPRRGMSREESLWQNELKDLIWLELQAFHADRTPVEEDEYLCSARQSVEPLLQNIMNYRFQRHSRKYSSQNSDSGLEDDCTGCNSIYCNSCMEAQNEALREIEGLMKRLEDVEALFPSSKAFAEMYPLYNSPEFVSRVKAISLWFNMTKIQRLKLSILGRLVLCLESKQGNWPVLCEDLASGSSSDSNNSTGSSIINEFVCSKNDNMYNIVPLAMFISKKDEHNISPYRRYIENVLKTRALYKSLNFLEYLHQHVLVKAQLTLLKPGNQEVFSKVLCDTEEEELQRFGCWSPEAKNIDLPSYRSLFLFLSGVPLSVIQEYLIMRLEQKPENPSPLSVRQLMRELKEGLKIAAKERQRIDRYLAAVKSGTDNIPDCHSTQLETFDKYMTKVFKDYLEYLEQWVLFHHNTFQKNLLEEEFIFSMTVINYVERGHELLGTKYANILGSILTRIAERLLKRVDEMLKDVNKEDANTLKQTLFAVCREMQCLFNEEREMSMKTMAFTKMFIGKSRKFIDSEAFKFLMGSVAAFKCIIPKAIAKVQSLFDFITVESLDDLDRVALSSRIREILMQIYRFGFEFYKEMTDGRPTDYRYKLVYSMVHFAKLWMCFVTERCERGRGMRPRWANQGMEFLLTVCEPANTKYLTEEEFDDLKKNMDECISHLIGTTAPSTPESGFYSASPRMSLEHIRTRSRGSSPSPRPTYKSQRSAPSRKTSVEQNSPSADYVDNVNLNFSLSPPIKEKEKCTVPLVKIKLPPKTYTERVIDAIETLDNKVNDRLNKQHLIGKILETNAEQRNPVRRRSVCFSWQRGIKIGQGRFGKVYTAVNNNTGEMMAVKEIPVQHNDSLAIKRVSDEMKILEGINHVNLVKYYGMEVYTDKMLLFMEFCAEGTLENLINATENGLPELLVRKYTYQLLSGIACLHDHGIVHRDIKPANIFLTHEGNCLKIGDFGCAAKIRNNSTMPGELKGFVGTQAYMAPEVFTKNMNEGHGRAADIWSVGCVVVEMSSGKRPWAHFDSNYQIMFKVGMGQSPDPPDDMIDEGLDFLEVCFKHNPKERATSHELLAHNFVKVGDDLI